MPTQVYNSGACFVYAGVGNQFAPLLVGTGERAPKRRTVRGWSPVFNDLAGDQDPFDELYEGQWCFVMVRLTKWDQNIVNQLQSTPTFPAAGALGGNPGTDVLGDVGTAMMTERALYPLWVLFDYGASGRFPKAAYTSGNMLAGRHYLGAKLEGPDEETSGTQANTIDLVWKCKRVYDPTTGNLGLYDSNMTGLPSPT